MTEGTMYIIWAVAIVGFGILEGVTFQLVSIWFVIGSVAGLISAFCGAPIYLQVVIAVVVSIIALLITRPIVKKKISAKIEPTNADRSIGSEGIVLEEIDNLQASGSVKVDGKIWTARSIDGSNIPENSTVVIEKIDGVKLIVRNK